MMVAHSNGETRVLVVTHVVGNEHSSLVDLITPRQLADDWC